MEKFLRDIDPKIAKILIGWFCGIFRQTRLVLREFTCVYLFVWTFPACCASYKDGARYSQLVKKNRISKKFSLYFLNLSCLIDRSSPSISEDASKFLNQITSPRRKTNHTQRPFIEVKQYFFLRFLWWKNWKIGCWLNRKSLWHCPRSLLKWLFIPLFVLCSRSRLDRRGAKEVGGKN